MALMKPDLYTKAVLTVIAASLVALAGNDYLNPKITAQAQPSQLQFSATGSNANFFNPATGELWSYRWEGRLEAKGKLTRPGGALVMDGQK